MDLLVSLIFGVLVMVGTWWVLNWLREWYGRTNSKTLDKIVYGAAAIATYSVVKDTVKKWNKD